MVCSKTFNAAGEDDDAEAEAWSSRPVGGLVWFIRTDGIVNS